MPTLAALFVSLAAAFAMSGEPVVPAKVQNVTIGGAFWGPRMAAVRAGTLAANRHQCDITGRVANFENAAKKIRGEAGVGEFQGLLFNDSDVYKMMEGWAYLIAIEKDGPAKAELEKDLEALIAKVAAAQYPDGYINTYYTLKVGADKRFTNEVSDHETYCLGHLLEAGVAHFEATGKRTLLEVAIKAADLLDRTYAPGRFSTPSGHEEVELALVRLADATGDAKYRALATSMVEMRGRKHRTIDGKMIEPWGDYAQDHKPVAEQTEAAGHAVRAGYLYAAMTDLSARGETKYVPALDALWEDVTQRRIFVTGGIGPSGHNEGFTVPYDIPINSAYQETCASIALCQWAERMFILKTDGKYMEQFERTLYNAVLAGVSLDGAKFFYVNPMGTRGGSKRSEWFGCACCPPNVLRFFASLGRNIYAVGGEHGDTVFVNLFVESTATLMVHGKPVEIEQKTDYPWGGKVKISVRNGAAEDITLAIRANPGMGSTFKGPQAADGYGRLKIQAGESSVTEWEIPLPAMRVYSDPRVKASVGRAAIVRGPLVYAAEAADNGGSVHELVLPASAEIRQSTGSDSVPVLSAAGYRAAGTNDDGLYRSGGSLTPVTITLRPYFMWGNRAPGEAMKVWLAESPQVLDPLPRPGVKASASFVGNGDGPNAMCDRVVPESASDGSIPRFTFWPKKGGQDGPAGTKQWVQYEFEKAMKVGEVSIWWFDDTGVGECRLPKSFTVMYRDGNDWKPVANPRGGALSKSAPSVVRFDAVEANALRIEIALPDKMSAGVLEWTVGG